MNIGTPSYGTGAFRAISALSESAIVDFYGTGDLQPEKKLMFAILLDAVECFQDYAEQDRLFKDAEEWIFEDDHEWPFSFINICEAVDMAPEYLRKGLLNWRQRAIPEANARCLSPRYFSKVDLRSTFGVSFRVSQILRRATRELSRSAESRRDKRRLRGREDFEPPSRRTKSQ